MCHGRCTEIASSPARGLLSRKGWQSSAATLRGHCGDSGASSSETIETQIPKYTRGTPLFSSKEGANEKPLKHETHKRETQQAKRLSVLYNCCRHRCPSAKERRKKTDMKRHEASHCCGFSCYRYRPHGRFLLESHCLWGNSLNPGHVLCFMF